MLITKQSFNQTYQPMSNLTTHEIDRTFKYQFYHRENTGWLSSLAFFKEELPYFASLLANVNDKNTALEIRNQTFVFEKELEAFNQAIDEIKQSIIEEEWGFDDDAMGRDFLLGEEIYNRHVGIRERFQQAEKSFLDIKHRLYRFLCKVL